MRSKFVLRWALVLLLVFIPSLLTRAQVVASATERTLPLVVGGGISGFDPDLYQAGDGHRWKSHGSGDMLGFAGWVDYYPRFMPRRLHGLGIEAQGRDSEWHRGVGEKDFVLRTVGGGAIYSWRHFQNLRPYGKGGVGIGRIKFTPVGGYGSDSRVIYYFGGGFEYRVWRHVWARADYEYEAWHLWHTDFAPQGVTLGATYHFGRVAPR